MRRKLFALIASAAFGLAGCDVTDPKGSGELSYAPCMGALGNPSWFAVQDGNGAWSRVTPVSGAYNFTIGSGRGGIAMVTDQGLFVLYGSTAELRTYAPSCNAPVRSVTGMVMGYASQDNINLQIGLSSGAVFGSQAQPSSFTLTSVEPTATDLIVVRHHTAPSSDSVRFEILPDNIVIRRGVSGTTTDAVNFASTTEAGAPVLRSVTVTNIVSGEVLSVLSNIATATTLGFIADYEAAASPTSGAVTAPFYGVPSARLGAGEGHMLQVAASRRINSTSREARQASIVFRDAVNKSITFGPALGEVTVAASTLPTASYTIQGEYANVWGVSYQQAIGNFNRQVEVLMTKGYLGSSATVSLKVPDLTGVAGFDTDLLLETGLFTNWKFLASNADITFLHGNRPISYYGAERTGRFTP